MNLRETGLGQLSLADICVVTREVWLVCWVGVGLNIYDDTIEFTNRMRGARDIRTSEYDPSTRSVKICCLHSCTDVVALAE
jgi:hypothetical protein